MNADSIRRFLLSLAVLLLAACGKDGPSEPPVPVEVLVTSSRDTLSVTGETLSLLVQVLNKKGKVLTGFPVTWDSSRPSVAGVDASGVVTAVGPGVTLVSARAAGLKGTVSLTVALEPVGTEVVGGEDQVGIINVELGEALQLLVTDGAGVPIPGVIVAFTVQQGGGTVYPGLSHAGLDGVAKAYWTLGSDPAETQSVLASVGALSVGFHASATWAPPRVVTTRMENGRSTLDYTRQLEAEGGNGTSYTWALVGGSLSPGLTLSPQGEVSGTPSEEGSFTFTAQVKGSEGKLATGEVALRVCPAPVLYEVGEVRVFDPTEADGCSFFIPAGEAGDRYRVGIVRSETNRNPHDVASVTLEVRGVGVQPTPPSFPAPVELPWSSHLPPSLQEAEAYARSTEAFHLRIREEERRFIATLPEDFRPLPSFSSESPALHPARERAAPARRMLNAPESNCSEAIPRVALLIGENEHIAIYQDSIQRTTELVGTSVVQAMLDYYRDYGKRVIDGYFGGVSDVNGDGQVVVFVAPGIDDGVAGFVRSSDLLGSEYCAGSNQMEITYLKASFVNGYESGNYQVVGTLVHEIKHISSLYRRLVARDFHPSWIEEGTAEIATDRASRLAMSETGGPGMGDMLTREDVVAFGRTVEGYNTLLRLIRSLRYMASQPNSVTVNPDGAEFWSPSGPQAEHTIYGAGWHFHRWLGDAYGGAATPFADAALFRVQNDSLTTSGPGAYPDLVGRTFSELMEEYALAVMLNGTGAPPPPRPFTSADFPAAMSATSVNSASKGPQGVYPWSVTLTEDGPGSVSLETESYWGPMGESGLRVYDFTSNGTGRGAEVTVFAPAGARIVVVRVR